MNCHATLLVRQGDYLDKIADRFGFDADTVWNDPSNDDLRNLRRNPNILLAGDMLQIPDESSGVATHDLTTGTTNDFVAPAPRTVTITHKFMSSDPSTYASRAYTIGELPDLTGLQTDGDGVLTFQAPVTLDKATVVFSDRGETWSLYVGYLDPIGTTIGIFERLQNLGYIPLAVAYDASELDNNLPVMRNALQALKADQGGNSTDAPDSGGPPLDPSTLDPGLADDGTLDDDTANLLLQVYGF